MQLEQLPLVLAVLVGLAGSALIVDAFLGERNDTPLAERRRRVRAERHRLGEGLVGLGVLAAAAGLAGRDSWRFGTLMIMGGVVLLLLGAVLNHRLLGEFLFHHGAARRQSGAEPASGPAGATAVPAGATAVPAGATAVPAGATAVPAGATAVPAARTTESTATDARAGDGDPSLTQAEGDGNARVANDGQAG